MSTNTLERLLARPVDPVASATLAVHAIAADGSEAVSRFQRREDCVLGRDVPGDGGALVCWRGRRHFVRVPISESESAFVVIGGKRRTAAELLKAGVAAPDADAIEIPVEPGFRVVVTRGGHTFVAELSSAAELNLRKARSFALALGVAVMAVGLVLAFASLR